MDSQAAEAEANSKGGKGKGGQAKGKSNPKGKGAEKGKGGQAKGKPNPKGKPKGGAAAGVKRKGNQDRKPAEWYDGMKVKPGGIRVLVRSESGYCFKDSVKERDMVQPVELLLDQYLRSRALFSKKDLRFSVKSVDEQIPRSIKCTDEIGECLRDMDVVQVHRTVNNCEGSTDELIVNDKTVRSLPEHCNYKLTECIRNSTSQEYLLNSKAGSQRNWRIPTE